MAGIKLNVEGMHCKSCSMLVEDDLCEIGAKDIRISLDEADKKAVVECSYDGDKMDVVNAIKKEGYRVRI